MKVGTKSVLFGVHCWWWHWLTVYLAWHRVHGRWPNWWQTISILCHDVFYWGCTDMDGPSGIEHPRGGAALAAKIVGVFSGERAFDAYFLCLYHSSTFAKLHNATNSDLYLPDKVSILMEPKWWYLFRARLSGEIHEYIRNSPHKDEADWYLYYNASVARKLKTHEDLHKL